MDRSRCWITTRMVVEVEHCPSLTNSIKAEVDKVIQFMNKQTDLQKFGKVHFLEANHVPSMSTKADS